ncbi:hypothetical protein FHX48_000268 [Microbacterium halimionae]|uniref:DUF2510 domain-containing protein n=1 Tax=Microbacterium halimionae TaxID=1526413 RepID=A0A7W3PKQ6_9MICO|nr:DUF2510 domain-containing protein [Microbacterium halimionae]MBA8815216.1 hypothetical protein [Microbacterium halimionae]NII93993.1 hypothetical protein [Microbacterium halimionae]
MVQQAAGWFSDLGNIDQQRWWDGAAWTEHVARERCNLVKLFRDCRGANRACDAALDSKPNCAEGCVPIASDVDWSVEVAMVSLTSSANPASSGQALTIVIAKLMGSPASPEPQATTSAGSHCWRARGPLRAKLGHLGVQRFQRLWTPKRFAEVGRGHGIFRTCEIKAPSSICLKMSGMPTPAGMGMTVIVVTTP